MGERNDDVRTPPATLEELVNKELKHTRHYRNHLESGETHYTSGRYEEAVVPLATADMRKQ
jgi:hypothetical protein